MKKSALVNAIERAKLELVSEQLKSSGPIGFNELHAAVCSGNAKIFAALVQHDGGMASITGKDEKSGRSLLHFAAEFGSLAIVKALLELGVDPSLKDKRGKTLPLILPLRVSGTQ